jgi:dTDP-4-amino-4,6-dideoxygalactose transaminase
MEMAYQESLLVLEDAAQGFGGLYKGRRAGGLGHAGATSFFPAKPLGCYGDGGAVFTDDTELYSKLLSIRVHGQGQDKYNHSRIGLNARLDSLQAAVLLPKLKIFPRELEARQKFSQMYNDGLAALQDIITTPFIPTEYKSCWAQYSLLTGKREAIMARLNNEGIPTAIYYPTPLHLQNAFEKLHYKAGDFPVAESVSQRIFSLPLHPYLNEEIIRRIVELIHLAV